MINRPRPASKSKGKERNLALSKIKELKQKQGGGQKRKSTPMAQPHNLASGGVKKGVLGEAKGTITSSGKGCQQRGGWPTKRKIHVHTSLKKVGGLQIKKNSGRRIRKKRRNEKRVLSPHICVWQLSLRQEGKHV